MKKFIGTFHLPCNAHTDSDAAKEYKADWPKGKVKMVSTDSGDLYLNFEKHYVGVINQRLVGGKWEKYTVYPRGMTIKQKFDKFSPVESKFRGGPRL